MTFKMTMCDVALNFFRLHLLNEGCDKYVQMNVLSGISRLRICVKFDI